VDAVAWPGVPGVAAGFGPNGLPGVPSAFVAGAAALTAVFAPKGLPVVVSVPVAGVAAVATAVDASAANKIAAPRRAGIRNALVFMEM
jgi:hypothetical protein